MFKDVRLSRQSRRPFITPARIPAHHRHHIQLTLATLRHRREIPDHSPRRGAHGTAAHPAVHVGGPVHQVRDLRGVRGDYGVIDGGALAGRATRERRRRDGRCPETLRYPPQHPRTPGPRHQRRDPGFRRLVAVERAGFSEVRGAVRWVKGGAGSVGVDSS